MTITPTKSLITTLVQGVQVLKKKKKKYTHIHKPQRNKKETVMSKPERTSRSRHYSDDGDSDDNDGRDRFMNHYHDQHAYQRHHRRFGWVWVLIFLFILFSFFVIISSDSDIYRTHIRHYIPHQVTRVVSTLQSHTAFSGDDMSIILSSDLSQCAIIEGNTYEVVSLTEGDHQCVNHFQRKGVRENDNTFVLEYDRGDLTYILGGNESIHKLCKASVNDIFFYRVQHQTTE